MAFCALGEMKGMDINMKEKAAVFLFAVLVITLLGGIIGINIMRGAYLNEIHTVQNLAGKVLSVYPEAEYAFLEGLGDEERQDMDAGAAILSHYGYDEEEKIMENVSYKRFVNAFILALAAFSSLYFCCIFAFLDYADRRRKRHEEEVLSILDCCLSGDYAFISDSDRLKRLNNPFFADTLVKLGRNLKLKTEQIREEQDNMKTLVTDISHQLKTPISALKACFSLYTDAEEAADREEFFARCRMQMDKLEMLTVALLQLSRLETHMIELDIEEVSLIDILTESVNMLYHKAKEKQISIETADFDNLSLKLDKKWTIEAVANVLDNAIKYSPEGAEIKVSAQKLYNYVRVEVEDNGIGIPRDEWNRIFKRFYRGNNDAVKRSEGTGVGLYLTRKILEDEGGTIFVRQARGRQGSVFCINLPV